MPIFYLDSGSIDTLEVSSSLLVSGSLVISGSMTSTSGLTGSLFGTSSWAINATSASFAVSASWAPTQASSGFPFAGIAVITGSIVLTSGSGFPSLLASETLAAGDLVNIHSGGVRKASSSDITRQAHGFVTQSAVATNPVVVFYSGLITNRTSLTAGSRYFLSTDGGILSTPAGSPNNIYQEVGVAISSNALLVNFGPVVIL